MIEPLIQTRIQLCWYFNLKRDVLMQTQPIFNFFCRTIRKKFYRIHQYTQTERKKERKKWVNYFALNTLSAISSNTSSGHKNNGTHFHFTFSAPARNRTHYLAIFFFVQYFYYMETWRMSSKEDFFQHNILH